MSELRVGNRISIFVTHVEFQNSGCQIFVQVGDLGSQADTVIERTDEYVGSGAAEIPASCSVGDLCLALFHEDNGWYRAKVVSVEGQSITVFFIDYGNTETVKIGNLRCASDFVLAIPALSTKCHVSDCIPLNEQSWTEEETKKIESMLHSQEFSAEIVSVDPSASMATCNVKLFKTDEPNVPVFLRKSASSSDLTIKMEELQVGQDYTVFVSFVESPQKFWIQLKDKEEDLNSLMSDIGACFAEDLPSSGDILNPAVNQICASCFSEDGSFYRAKVQNISGDSCKVFFVDYGNSENKSTSELFTLPQALSKLPVQAIQCMYKSNVDMTVVKENLHKLETDGTTCVMKVLSKSNSGYVVAIDSIEKIATQSQTTTQPQKAKGDGKLWTSIPSVVMQVGGVYDVCISHIEHPGRFFVQLIGNASKLDEAMQSIDEIAHNLEGLVISNPGNLCLAKFSDSAWYRSEILSVENGKLTVGAVDFGFIEDFQSKQSLRIIDSKFKDLPAQSVICSLDSDRLNSQDWSRAETDKFSAMASKTALVCKVKAKTGAVFQVDLFDTTGDQERHINKELQTSSGPVVNQSVQRKPDTGPSSQANLTGPSSQANLPPPETTLGSKLTLCITALKATLVFGQVTHTPVEKVAKLQTDLNTYYDKKSTETLNTVTLGSVCCTQYSDGGWYRGIVTSVKGSQVEVSFADFGDCIMKSKSDLKVLVSNLCELPQQCVLVSIENLPSVPASKLESVLVNNRIDVKLKSKEGGVYPQFVGELLSQSVLDELEGKPASGFGAKRNTGFGQSSDSGSQRSFGSNRESGFGSKRESGFGDNRDTGFGAKREGGGFGAKQDGGFGGNRGGGFGGKREGGGFGGNRDGGGFGGNREGGGFGGNREGGGFGGNRDGGGFGGNREGGGFGGKREGGGFGGNRDGGGNREGGGFGGNRGGFGGQREERNFGGSTEKSGFGERKEGGGFGDKKGGFGGNREDRNFGGNREGGGFAKREGGFGNKGSEESQERSNFRGPRAPSGDSSGFTKQSVTIGSTKGVMVTYVRDPGHFQVVLEDMSDSLDLVMDQLHEHYDKLPPNGEQLVDPRLGQGCVAQYSEDKGWYRAVVSGLLSNGLSEVMFVDYGNNECTPRETLKVIQDKFMVLPAQAILCSLAGVSPSQGFWSPEHTVQFEEMVVEQSFTATFKSQNREPGQEVVYKVELVDKKNVNINQKFGTSTGTTCVESGPGPSNRTVSSGNSGMNVTVSTSDDWDEGGDTAKQGFGQGRKFGGERGGDGFRGGQGGERGFSSRERSDRSSGFGGDRNDRGFGDRKGGFGGDRQSDNRDRGREGGFQQRQDREGGGFGGRGGFNKEEGGRGFGQSGDRSGGVRSGGFGQRSREDGGGDQGGFGGKRGFSQGEGINRGGDAGFGGNKGGFGGNKGGFGENKGGFGGNKGGFGGNKGFGGGGGGNAAAEDDWGDEATPVPVALPAKPASPQIQSISQPASTVKRFRGLNMVDEDASGDVFVNLNLNIRESVDVYVVYTVNPELFYCQVIKNSASLSEMMAQMNSYYEALSEGEMSIEKPEIGMPCAAKFSEDDTWYRAEIQTPGQTEVEVQFVDYGNTETISVSKIRKLKPEYMKMKSQGVKCGLDGVVAQNKVWEDKAVEDFEDLTMDKHLVAKIINRSSDGTHLLELENIDEKVNVGDSMCDKGHCTYVSSKISPKKDQIIESPYPALELSVGSEIDVYVSWIENPEIFWIQPVSDEEKLVGFVDCIQELYTSGAGANMNVTSVMPGQAVVALFSEDGAWYRGYVEKKGGKDIKVRFVDYGNSDMVTKESMRQPTEAMFKEASHAALCKLQGVRPLQTGVWTPDAKDIMNSLVSDVVKCKIIDVSGKQYTVQLTAGETDVTKELIQAAVVRAEKEPSPPKTDDSLALKIEKPKTLYFQSQIKVIPGSTEPVYVTQTDSVASFWCQLVKYYSQLDEVMGKLDTSCQSSVSPVDFTVNMACGAKFSGDQSWYRAKVTAVYPDSVEVLFVDYGNSEKVPKSDTRHLTEELVDLPAQAIHCTLENSALSTNQLTKKFVELTSDVEISMTTVEEQEDITVVRLALSSGENVAEQLGLVELKQAADTNERKEQIRTDSSAVGTVVRDQKYPTAERPTSIVQVYISQIISPGDFCIQLVSQESSLNELMETIAMTYEDETKYKVSSVVKGQPCCSKFSDDGAWYRAQVTNVSGSDITVTFVDYGNQETTNINSVREITKEIIGKAPFAYSCRLDDIGPSRTDSWSAEAIELFEQLILDQELTCQFLTDSEVKLTLNDEDVGEKLIEKGAAKYLKTEVKAKAGESIKVSYTNYKIPAPPLPTGSTACFVSHVRTNGTIYIQLACEEEKLNTITEFVQDKAPSLPELHISDLKEGYFCIAKFSEDQAWYRAVAEDVTDSTVTVRFVDYGNSDKVETSVNLKCPTEDLSKEHPYAYQCQLYGVASLEALDADRLMEVTLDKELTCIFHSSEVPYKVELHDEEGQNIVQLVMKEAVSEDTMETSSTEVDRTQFETGEAVSEDMVATTSTEVEGMPSETVTAVDDNRTSENGELEPEPADLGIDLDNFVRNSGELNTETLENEERVQVLVAQAESPTNFWVQLANKKQQLDELLDQMFELYSTLTDDRVKSDSFDENCVVAAQFSEDESWYRAKVLKVEEDGIVVQFLDHGNKELVPLSSLRKLPSDFSKLPCQGIQCSLAGVVPKEGGEWSAETIKTFSEIVLEKELLLDVCGILGEDIYQVQLLDMGIPVSEILVQRGVGVALATPIPVSTKTKQVFSPETKEDIIARLFEPKATEKLTKYRYKLRDFGQLEPTIEHSAVIRVINTPTDFWCQMSDSSYDYLQEKLLEFYSGSSDQLQDVEVGSRCVVKLNENDFFRGSVLKVDTDEDKMTVICVDNGYIHEVKKADLLQYKTEFDKFPQLAFQCALDIKSMTSVDEWDTDVCDKFREVVLECSEVEHLPAYAKMTIVRLQEDLVIVKLTIDRLVVAEHLVKLDMAELCEHVEKLEIKEDVYAKTSQKPSDFGSFVNVRLPVDSEHDVHLVDCDNLDRLVFHTEESIAVIAEVTAKIAEFVKDHEPSGESWSVGQGCLFKCPDDELWYRANIISTEEEKCQVFLVDYGSTYSVSGASLLPLPEDLTEIKAQAVICKLAEIEPVDEDWTEEAKDFFSGQFDHDEESALCTYVMSYEEGVHEITLSEASDAKTANMMMAELEYAVPVLGSALEMELLTGQAETSFHELSLAREDSYDSELGETSNEVDTTCLTTDDSHLEPDTSCLDTETSQLDTDISCLENDQSGMVGDTSVDRSGLDTEMSYAETDTSQEVTDMSHLETDTSALETDTSCLDTDTSCLDTDTSCLETTDTSCLETTDTSVVETDTTETSCVTDSDTSVLQAPIMEKENLISVAEEEGLNIAKSENLNLDGEKDNNGNIINLQNNICLHHIEDRESDESNYEDADMNLGMNRSDLVGGDINKLGPDSLVSGGSDLEESRLNFSYSPTGYTTSELDTTDMTGLETTADVEGLETTTDMTELETTTDSLFTIDQTGFTDFDTSNVTHHRSDTETADTYGVERQAEALNVAEEETCVAEIQKDNTSADVAESRPVEPSLETREEAFKDITVNQTENKLDAMEEKLVEDISNNQTNVTEVEDVLSRKVEEGSDISEHAYGIDQELNFEEEVYQSDDDTAEQVDSSFTDVTALTHPSISDTAHGSVSDEAVLVDELGDRLANTNIASRMQSISICETCGSDVSSYLDTTGCSSEFSFYVCHECQQLKEENVPASDFHSDIDAADNNRSKKFSEVFEVAAESEEDKEYDDSSTHAVEQDIDNKLPDRRHESIIEEISVLDRQKEEQSVLGQYSAVVLTPLEFKSETVDEKLKQESEYDYNDVLDSGQAVAKETETRQFDTGETEDQYVEQEIADTLEVLEPNKDIDIVAEVDKISTEKTCIDDGELDTNIKVEQVNGGSESKELCLAISEDIVAQAVGNVKEFHPVEILDEVSQILSDLQDMVCGEESADAVSRSAAFLDNQELQEIESNIHYRAALDSKVCVSEGNRVDKKLVDLANISSNYEKETVHEPPLPPEYNENITGIDNTVNGFEKYHQTETVEIEENLVMDELEKLSIERKGTGQDDLDIDEKSADVCINEKETVDEHVELPPQLENVTENIDSVDGIEDKDLIKESIAILNTQNSLYDEEELATAEHETRKEQQPTADPAAKEDSDRIKIDNNQIDTAEIHTIEDTLLLIEPKAEDETSQSCTETAEEGEDTEHTGGAEKDGTVEQSGDTTDVSQPKEESESTTGVSQLKEESLITTDVSKSKEESVSNTNVSQPKEESVSSTDVSQTKEESVSSTGVSQLKEESLITTDVSKSSNVSQPKEESVTDVVETELDESETKTGLTEGEGATEEQTANGDVAITTEEAAMCEKVDVVPRETDAKSENVDDIKDDDDTKDVNGTNNVTEEQTEPNNNTDGQNEDDSVEIKSKEALKAVPDTAQSDDSDTEAFEDADVAIEENGVTDRKREKVSSDKESADDSEAFYDVESDEDAKVKET